MAREKLPSVCPRDCPGARALIIVEKLPNSWIGHVCSAVAHPYNTEDIICAKDATTLCGAYLPPHRLYYSPLRRVQDCRKRSGRFQAHYNWEEALDTVVTVFHNTQKRFGRETV